jgi:hypothetical protein
MSEPRRHRYAGRCWCDDFHRDQPTTLPLDNRPPGSLMDIEERAWKWAREHAPTRVDGEPLPERLTLQFAEWLRDAYLAGSAQAQADYAAHYSR